MAEETKDSTHTFPRTLFLGLGIAGTIYLLVTIVAGMAVPADKLAESDGPLLEVVALGPLALNSKVFSAIALFALINGCLLNLVMASRLMYGMARENVVPGVLGRVHAGRKTPWVAILFTAAIAAVLVTLGDLETLADTTVLLLLLVFIGVHIALLVLRRTPVDTTTSAPGRCCRGSASRARPGGADRRRSRSSPVGGGLLALGLVLWVIERAVR